MAHAKAPVINPTVDDAHWRHAFQAEPYYKLLMTYDDYSPAYRVGYTGPSRRSGNFGSMEADLRHDWERVNDPSRLSWGEAQQAMHAAWNRVGERNEAVA